MRIVFFGTPYFSSCILQAILNTNYEVKCVITSADSKSGRGKKLKSCHLKNYCTEKNVDCMSPMDLSDPQFIENLKSFTPEILELNGVTGMHVILGNSSYGQMNTKEKKYRSSQGLNDQIVSQAVIIEGLNYLSLETAIKNFKNKYSLRESKNLIINYYFCQNVLTQQDLLQK